MKDKSLSSIMRFVFQTYMKDKSLSSIMRFVLQTLNERQIFEQHYEICPSDPI
jgi:hypothetical protein